MSQELRSDFASQVERAVRPIVAGAGRKRMMREELLAHLLDIYEEECARLGAGQAAKRAAKRRFGNVQELGRQLQASVPAFERVLSQYFPFEENVMSRWLIAGVVAILVLWVVAFPEAAEFAVGALTMLAGVWFVRICQQTDWMGRRWPWFVGCLGIAVGPGLILPALAKCKEHGDTLTAATIAPLAFPLLLGLAITLGGFGCIAYGIKLLRTPAA